MSRLHDGFAVTAEILARLEGIEARLGAQTILAGVDIAVARGEIVTIIGPNGAGKTTLLRVLLGLLAPSAGLVWRRPGLRIGYMPQRLAIDEALPLTVGRLLTLAGGSAEETREALAELDAAHLARAPVQGLSGGELQRVMLARTLVRRPDLLVLDEPVQAVDFIGEAKLYELISGIRRRHGCGILMVSHDLHMVMAESDHVVCLNGHVCCEGGPEKVQRDPEFARLFGPSAAKMIAAYTHRHDHDHESHDHHHH